MPPPASPLSLAVAEPEPEPEPSPHARAPGPRPCACAWPATYPRRAPEPRPMPAPCDANAPAPDVLLPNPSAIRDTRPCRERAQTCSRALPQALGPTSTCAQVLLKYSHVLFSRNRKGPVRCGALALSPARGRLIAFVIDHDPKHFFIKLGLV
jgi:hypothetical protein